MRTGLGPVAGCPLDTWVRPVDSDLATQSGRDEHGPVLLDVEKLLRLWTEPLPQDDEAAADAFRRMYADPVAVNGTALSAADLVARARVMQVALAEPEREVLAVVESGDAVAVAFRLGGRRARRAERWRWGSPARRSRWRSGWPAGTSPPWTRRPAGCRLPEPASTCASSTASHSPRGGSGPSGWGGAGWGRPRPQAWL